MAGSVENIIGKLFYQDLNQKIVREISKDVETMQLHEQEQLIEKIDYHIRTLLKNDPIKSLTAATLMMDGSRVLKKAISQCGDEILKVSCSNIDSLHIAESRKQSEFHIAAKAVYGIIQYVLPMDSRIIENPALKFQLKRVYSSLLRAIISEKLPSDCSLIVSTSLCIASALICESNEEVNFMNLANSIHQLDISKETSEEMDSKEISEDLESTTSNAVAKDAQDFFIEISPSYPVVLLLHGLFNSNPCWLYAPKYIRNENDMDNSGKVFLEYVHPLIMKMCKTATSYIFQAFQVLHMWLTCVRKYGRKLQEKTIDFKDNTSGYGVEQCHPASWSLFQIQAEDSNTVFQLLNSNWENPAKGVSDVVFTCMFELLELHEDRKTGQAKILARNMLNALVSSAAWSSKSTYPPIALSLSFIGAKEALEHHPSLPLGLYESLKVNHLASAGTSVYKIVLSHLSSEEWQQYFLTIISAGLHSQDRMIQQNILTLWLPPTLRQYRDIYQKLIAICQGDSSGWLARIAILRVARSQGLLELKENSCIEIDDNYLSVMDYIEAGLSYIDETVRGEAIAFLCCTQKGSLPVSMKESELLKEFFRWNMNIDSAPFRQGIIKCYKALVTRLRDTSAAELKKLGYKSKNSCIKLELQELPVLKVNSELLVWFIHFLHENLAPDGNYQRRILSLQLYRETLLAFYDITKTGNYSMNSRCANVSGFISFLSGLKDNMIVGITLPWTQEMLLSSCMDEMNDVREEAVLTLKILETSENSLTYSDAYLWLMRGISMCDSPKASYAESGATLVKVVTSACHANNHDITSMLRINKTESVLTFLYCRVKEQLDAARVNLLEASQKAPIHGTLMGLGYCLCRDSSTTGLTEDDVQEFMHSITDLLIELTEFLLSKLAYASPSGSAVAPSFAEMGESIEMIIKECEQLNDQEKLPDRGFHPENNVEVEDVDFEDNAISGSHQLILACCWQTMKACCNVTSMCITHYLESFKETDVERLIQGVIVRILTGTRHKGAMEAARASYGQLCSVLLSIGSNRSQLVYKQVNEVLDQLESGAQTSVTRRGAGISMMMQVACGAAPRTNAALINTTVLRLIHISQLEYEEQNTVDASPVLALHILQSLVLHAPLAHHLLHHLPAITTTCLYAFTNHSWALRNAALQLYGAVVPRMVGQKKVRDDSSSLNSLTAPEFLARHPFLSQSLLRMLLGATLEVKNENSFPNNERENFNKDVTDPEDSVSIKVSSSLVPVLSLLARLSPGTGLQQNAELRDMLQQYCCETMRLLGSPIHTVRRLASLATVALTPSEDVLQLVSVQLEFLQKQDKTSNNLIHGKLLTLMSIINSYPDIKGNSKVKKDVTTTLLALIKSNNRCYINIAIAVRICELFETDVHIERPLESSQAHPGAPEYFKLVSKIQMNHRTESEMEKFLISLFLENQDMEEVCFDYIQEHMQKHKTSPWLKEIEKLLWSKLEYDFTRQWNLILKTLGSILREQGTIYHKPSEGILRNMIYLLQGQHGVKIAAETLIIVAYIFKSQSCFQWPTEDIRRDLLQNFSSLVSTYAAPTSTEDYRMAASEALKVSFRILFNNSKTELVCYEQLVYACVELLQDEDCTIRESACHIVESLTENVEQSGTICSTGNSEIQLKAIHLLHPNLALKRFLLLLISGSANLRDGNVLKLVWRLCINQGLSFGNSTTSGEESAMSKSYLFQSHTMNLYKEPKKLSIMSSELLLKALTENKDQMKFEDSSWIHELCEFLNQKGQALQNQLSTDTILVIKKELLVELSTYIVAVKTLSEMGKMFNIHINISYPLCWSNRKFCVVDCQ